MFSQTQEYALRSVICLARQPEGEPVGNLRIAEETQVPPSYLSKVMQELARAGILTSRRGAKGGFTLAHDPSETTVLEVLNAVDPIKRIHSCPLALKSHKKKLCSMHARLDAAVEMVEQVFATSTIKDLMSESGRPLPMLDGPVVKSTK